jgi:hypothetical protein
MPLIILIVDLLLDTTIIYDYSSKGFFCLRIFEGLAALSDLVQQLMPLVNIIPKDVVNLRGFDVPESLIGLPCLHIIICAIDLPFKDHVRIV